MPDYEEHLSRSYLETFLVMDDDLEHHDRLRRIAQSKLDTKTVERMRPWIERAISEIVQRYVDDGGGDFVAQVAFQVAIVVISEVMGLPSEDRAWYWTTLKTSSVALEPTCSPESLAEADAATRQLVDYWAGEVEKRQKEPREDLVSELLTFVGNEVDDGLSVKEVVDLSQFFFSAGFETTVNTLGLGMLALLNDPEQLALLRSDVSLARDAAEEVLRCTATVTFTGRVPSAPVSVGDAVLPADETVYAWLAAANRDPSVFADPDRFDILRQRVPHLTFGFGSHLCLGAPLARAEIEITLREMARRCATLELAGVAEHRPGVQVRALASLPLRVTASAI
jgi:cytochrome P450